MSDHPPSRLSLPKEAKVEFHRLRLKASAYLQNLRSFEVSGSSAQVGISTEAIEGGEDCVVAHQTTLERLIGLLFVYYRHLYSMEDLLAAIARILPDRQPELPDADNLVDGTAHLPSGPALDIRALEQMSVDMAVSQCYLDPRVIHSPKGFLEIVPTIAECYRTPVFGTSAKDFYSLIVVSFDRHPARGQVHWKTTTKIRRVYSTGRVPLAYSFTTGADAPPVVRTSPR